MTLEQWAIKHAIPYAAVHELRAIFGAVNTDPSPQDGESEAAVQTRVRLEASAKGCRLLRNNVGVLYDERGVPVRYGLANDSKQMNDHIKSSDLIGIRPLLIQPYHVGSVLGQFMAREIKPGAWSYSGTAREVAQLRFMELVVSMGGDACFANGEGTI
jgi:hypothetical protein